MARTTLFGVVGSTFAARPGTPCGSSSLGAPPPAAAVVRDHLEDESGEVTQLGLTHCDRVVTLLHSIDLLPQVSEFVLDVLGDEVDARRS
jgi:hypothetical protein